MFDSSVAGRYSQRLRTGLLRPNNLGNKYFEKGHFRSRPFFPGRLRSYIGIPVYWHPNAGNCLPNFREEMNLDRQICRRGRENAGGKEIILQYLCNLITYKY